MGLSLNVPSIGSTDWGTDVNENWSTLQAAISPAICNGRLTLESGTPVSTSDLTARATLYFTPYRGNLLGLYDGSSAWNITTFTERSLSLSGLTASTNYDIFIYDNSGTLTLESVAWSSDTARATALTTQDGIYVKSGATSHRYLGTIRINSTGGQCEDTATQRFVWNYYNRVSRKIGYSVDASHAYTTVGVWRKWNDSDSSKYAWVQGVAENTIGIYCYFDMYPQGSAYVGIGIDSSSSPASQSMSTATGIWLSATVVYVSAPLLGYHCCYALEFTGTGSSQFSVLRMNGEILA